MRDRAPVDRGNRTVLVFIALLLLAAGGVVLALGLGAFGSAMAEQPVITEQVSTFVSDNWWVWLLALLACVLLAVLLLRWIAAQAQNQRISELHLERDDRSGSTVLDSGALTNAVEDEVEGYRGVRSASARVMRERGRSGLRLVVELEERVDIADVRSRLERDAVPHLREALESEDFPVDVRLRPGAAASGRRAVL
jgi:membrane protein implicated in regulation of membrane protease activity